MKLVKSLLVVVCVNFFVFGTAQAAIETFDSYPTHNNTTNSDGVEADLYLIYGDSPTNSQVIGAWEGEVAGGLTGAGIGSSGQDTYAFGTGSGSGLTAGDELGIMDFGMHEWGMTSGVIADYLGAGGLDLHGGTLDVRALLAGNFSGQIQLGFVSNSKHDFGDGDGLEWVEFFGPTFAITDSFAWYNGDLNNFMSDVGVGVSYGDSPGVKVLDVWVDLFSSEEVIGTVSGELRIDQIDLVPEPASLVILMAGCTALLKQRAKRRRQS